MAWHVNKKTYHIFLQGFMLKPLNFRFILAPCSQNCTDGVLLGKYDIINKKIKNWFSFFKRLIFLVIYWRFAIIKYIGGTYFD